MNTNHFGKSGLYLEECWKRRESMNLVFDILWNEVTMRFIAYSANVDTCIVGVTMESKLKRNIKIIEKGPLPKQIDDEIKNVFKENDRNWIGQI